MAGPYADVALVKKMLRAIPGMETDEDVTARIDALNLAVSLALEEACQRTWGAPVSDTSEIVWVGQGETIILPRPARAITSITYGGTLAGTTMTGGTTVLPADLIYSIVDRNGLIWGIAGGTSSVWWWNYAYLTPVQSDQRFPVVVTGDFVSSDNDASVPADITYIATYMVVERLKVEKASSFGQIGPDGDVLPVRDVFADPLVKRVIDKYARELAVVV